MRERDPADIRYSFVWREDLVSSDCRLGVGNIRRQRFHVRDVTSLLRSSTSKKLDRLDSSIVLEMGDVHVES